MYWQLASRGVTHGGVQPEWSGSALAMRVVSLPRPAGAEPAAAAALRSRLLAATVRLTTKNQTRVWTAEFVFHGSPVRTPNPKEQGMLTSVQPSDQLRLCTCRFQISRLARLLGFIPNNNNRG